MGILDDAIREHLDLKRQVGARDAEIKKLEDEAFGSPARPGEPEFGEPEEADSEAEALDETDDVAAATESDGMPGDAGAAPEAGAAGVIDAPDANAEAESSAEPADWLDGASEPAAEDDAADVVMGDSAEQARLDHPELEDTEVHERVEGGPEVEATEAPAEPELDAEDFDVGDLSLAIDDEPEPADAQSSTPPIDHAAEEQDALVPTPFDAEPLEDEPQAESLPEEPEAAAGMPFDAEALEDDASPPEQDAEGSGGLAVEEAPTEERPLPPDGGPAPEPGDEGHLREQAAEDAQPVEEAGPEESGEGADSDDLLEETPEFLRDAPESDKLWFEQGKPQDFDFDDEED